MNPAEKEALRFDENWKRDEMDRKNNAFREFQARVADDKATTAAAMKILQPQAAVAVAVEEPVEEVEEIDPNSVELTGDFSEIVAAYHKQKYEIDASSVRGHWMRRKRAQIGLAADVELDELQFSISVTAYDADGKQIQVVEDLLVEPDFSIEPGTRISRGVLGEVNISEKTTGVFGGFFHFDDSDKLDLVSARVATDAEVEEFFKPPVVEVPAPPAPPVYRKIERVAGDATSRLGFTIGTPAVEVKTTLYAGWHAFCVAHPTVIGKIESPVEWEFDSDTVRLEIYDASGQRLLQTRLCPAQRGIMRAEFDEIRLDAGDYLLIWTHFGGRSAKGVKGVPNVGLFERGIPQKPILDKVVAKPETIYDVLRNCEVAPIMPQFRFRAS